MEVGKMAKLRRSRWMYLFWIGMFVLNWLALDDITTGNEPELWGEWFVVIVTGAYLAMLGVYKFFGNAGK